MIGAPVNGDKKEPILNSFFTNECLMWLDSRSSFIRKKEHWERERERRLRGILKVTSKSVSRAKEKRNLDWNWEKEEEEVQEEEKEQQQQEQAFLIYGWVRVVIWNEEESNRRTQVVAHPSLIHKKCVLKWSK